MKYYSEETVRRIITDTVYATLHVRKISTTEDYPCIELPDKHGRLKDAYGIMVKLRVNFCNDCEHQECDECKVQKCWEIVRDAPVIVEATE